MGAIIIVAVTVWWNYLSPEGKRRTRLEAARLHAKNVVMPLLAKEHRFTEVRATELWKDEGYFWVRGGVETEADLQDLKRLIADTHPPAPVAWDVEVFAQRASVTNKP